MNIAFIGRGRVGHEALKKLMLMPDINIKFIVTCKFTEEVEVENEVFEEIAKELDIPYHHTNNINTMEWERKFHGLELVAAMLWFNTIDEKIIKETAKSVNTPIARRPRTVLITGCNTDIPKKNT